MDLLFTELKSFYAQKEVVIPKFAPGRLGSQQFEENFLLPFLEKHKEEFIVYFNAQQFGHSIISADFTVSNSENDRRSFADISFIVRWPDDTVSKEFVNIKFSSFVGADNICGWGAFNYVLYGDLLYKSKDLVFERIKTQPLSDRHHDYWIWAFNKNAQHSIFSLFHSSEHTSLLLASNNLVFNFSQSFPMQLCHGKNEHPTDCCSKTQREFLVRSLVKAYHDFHEKQLATIKQLVYTLDGRDND